MSPGSVSGRSKPTNPTEFPITYSASSRWKVFLAVLGLPVGIGGVAGVWYLGTGHEVTGGVDLALMVGVSLLLSIFGFWCAIGPLVSRILVIHQDRLVVPGIFRSTVLRRSEILGYRVVAQQGTRVLRLHFKGENGAAKRTGVPLLFSPDEAFSNWFSGIPDLDEVEYDESVREIRMDERLGNTPEERLEKAARARKRARILDRALLVLCGWVIFYPRPYTPLFLLVASSPLLVLWLGWRHPGAVSIDDSDYRKARANLSPSLITPGMVLALRAVLDVDLLAPAKLVLPAILCAAALVAGIAWVAPSYRRSIGRLLLVTVLMAAYSASVIAISDRLFDRAAAEQEVVRVVGKYHTTGKGASQYLRVAPSDALPEIDEVSVTKSLYRQTETGQSICLSLHPGALGLEWYSTAPARECLQ